MRIRTVMIATAAAAFIVSSTSLSSAKGHKKYGGHAMFKRADTDKNGVLSKEEVRNAHQSYIHKVEKRLAFLKEETKNIDKNFAIADLDKDGSLSKKEAKTLKAMRRDAWKEEHGDAMKRTHRKGHSHKDHHHGKDHHHADHHETPEEKKGHDHSDHHDNE